MKFWGVGQKHDYPGNQILLSSGWKMGQLNNRTFEQWDSRTIRLLDNLTDNNGTVVEGFFNTGIFEQWDEKM